MHPADAREQGYVVPTYRAPADACWYHFLHGNVPGYQIDFIYRAEVPQGGLTQQHFSHLARIIKYIEPRAGAPFAFAIGNLSRDDTQHEPGHGGVALILGHRMKGATDHAGRRDPPFAHGIAAVGKNMDSESLFAAAMAFCRHMLAPPSADEPRSLAPMYARFTAAGPSQRVGVVEGYLEGFDDLPKIEPSRLSKRWICRGGPPVKRILIGHAEDASFEVLARVAARVAAMLYQSDIRWTSITTGRDPEIPNGVSIRLVPRREAVASDADTRALQIEQVPEEEAEIAAQLFGAVASDRPRLVMPLGEWRASARSAPSEPAQAPSAAEATPAEEPKEASFDPHVIEATKEDAPSEDVAVARGGPLLKDAELEVSSADREPRLLESTAEAQVKEACEDQVPGGGTAALETSQGSGGEEFEAGALYAEPRRRRSVMIRVLAAGAVGLLVALVFFGRLTMGEREASAIADPSRYLLGSAALTLAKLVRDAAVVEGKSAAGSGEAEGRSMALFPAKMAAVKPAADSGSKAPGSHRQPRWQQPARQTRAERPAPDGEAPPFVFPAE